MVFTKCILTSPNGYTASSCDLVFFEGNNSVAAGVGSSALKLYSLLESPLLTFFARIRGDQHTSVRMLFEPGAIAASGQEFLSFGLVLGTESTNWSFCCSYSVDSECFLPPGALFRHLHSRRFYQSFFVDRSFGDFFHIQNPLLGCHIMGLGFL